MAHQLSWLYHSISPHKGDSLFNLPPQGSSLYYLILSCSKEWTSMVAQMVKNLPPMQETQVQFLGQEDPVEKGIATHFSILAWRIPWTEEPGGLQSRGSQRVRYNWVTLSHTHTHWRVLYNFPVHYVWTSPGQPDILLHKKSGVIYHNILLF